MHFETFMADDLPAANVKLVPLLISKLETLEDEYHGLCSESVSRALAKNVSG